MAGARKGSDQIKVARAVVRGQGERMSNGREDGEDGVVSKYSRIGLTFAEQIATRGENGPSTAVAI